MKSSLSFFVFSLAFLFCLSVSAQQKKETKYYSITIPSSWTYIPMDMPGMMMESLGFSNANSSNLGMLLVTEVDLDPDNMIESQLAVKTNPLFQNVERLGGIHTTQFLGKRARACNFKSNFMGQQYKGTIYCFKEGGCTVCAIGTYTNASTSKLPSIWKTLKWKPIKKKEDPRSLEEQVMDFARNYTQQLQNMGGLSMNGATMYEMNFDKSRKCLIYVIGVDALSIEMLDESTIDLLSSEYKKMGPTLVKTMGQESPFIQRCIDAGFNFEFKILDKNKKQICKVFLTPKDYR